MRMRIRGRSIDMAHVKSFVLRGYFSGSKYGGSICSKYVLALSNSTGNGYAEYGSNVVKMSERKHVVILGLGAV